MDAIPRAIVSPLIVCTHAVSRSCRHLELVWCGRGFVGIEFQRRGPDEAPRWSISRRLTEDSQSSSLLANVVLGFMVRRSISSVVMSSVI